MNTKYIKLNKMKIWKLTAGIISILIGAEILREGNLLYALVSAFGGDATLVLIGMLVGVFSIAGGILSIVNYSKGNRGSLVATLVIYSVGAVLCLFGPAKWGNLYFFLGWLIVCIIVASVDLYKQRNATSGAAYQEAECGKEITKANVCPHCGASVGEGDAFCQNCGKRVDDSPSTDISNITHNKCPLCGASVNEGDVFCQNCGRNLIDGSYADNSIINNQIQDNEESPTRNWIPYILGAIALLAICGGGWWYYNSSNLSQTVNDGDTAAAEETAIADTLAADIVAETNIDNTGVEMPNVHKIGNLFAEMESGKLTALKDYGFSLYDKQSKMIMSAYAEEDEADIKLTKETYYLKYKIGTNPSDMSDGYMKICYVYAKDYGEPYMTIECDSKTWNELKFEAESSLKKLVGNSYHLQMYSFIQFDYEGVITVSTDNSVEWE